MLRCNITLVFDFVVVVQESTLAIAVCSCEKANTN
jgi:hypothetical protein